MSGNSMSNTCPNCGKEMSTYQDYKPHDYVSGECLHCGFSYWTIAEYMSLEDLNDQRQENGMRPLKKQPKQKF